MGRVVRVLFAELDTLRERQVLRPVDGVGLATHISFPGVRTRFPAATGLFLAAKRAAKRAAARKAAAAKKAAEAKVAKETAAKAAGTNAPASTATNAPAGK